MTQPTDSIRKKKKKQESGDSLSNTKGAAEVCQIAIFFTAQSRKAAFPMLVTESGIVKFARALQFAKALLPMVVTEFGIVKLAKELQFANALLPMVVTEFGMVKLVKELQPAKAPL